MNYLDKVVKIVNEKLKPEKISLIDNSLLHSKHKYYDSETDTIYDITETTPFVSDMILGNVMTPEILNSSGEINFSNFACFLVGGKY